MSLYVHRVLFVILMVWKTSSFAQCTLCFNAAVNYAVLSNPYGICSADFNNDGLMDLAVANWGSSKVSVLLNTGAGAFGAANNFNVSTNPRAICSGDFNNDGKADLATCNDGANNVSVMLGNGLGSFGAASGFTVAASPECIVTKDFNLDGNADIATCSYGSQVVTILLGNGLGSFGAGTNYSTGASSFPYGICSGDFNNDGKWDVVTVSYSSTNANRLTGNGLGGFSAAVNYANGTGNAYAVCTDDFNNDGKADIAIANSNNNNMSLKTGNGTGAFAASTTFAAGSFPFCITSGDFNNDAKRDVVVGNYSSNNVSILLGTGTGSFCAAANFGVGTSPTSVAGADFNGDGRTDVAVTNNNSNNVSVLLSCGPLPVELISFAGKVNGEKTELSWQTGSERNSDYFSVERKQSGNEKWEEIGRVKAAGNSEQPKNYQFVDEHPSSVVYYRLRQINYDDGFTYSNIIYIDKNEMKPLISIFPNPASTVLNCGFSVKNSQPVQIVITDVLGNSVLCQNIDATKGQNDLKLDIGQFSPGVYFIQTTLNSQSARIKFVKGDR